MCPVFARDSIELHFAYCYHAYQICNCKKNKSITVDYLHALLQGRSINFDQNRLLSINVNYCLLLFYYYRRHRRALLYDLFARSFMLRANNHIRWSAAIWLCYVVLYAQMFLLHYSNHGTQGIRCRARGVTLWSRKRVLIVFGTAHRIIVVKLLPKFQAPVCTCTSWWVTTATERHIDRQTSKHTFNIHIEFLFLAVLSPAAVNGYPGWCRLSFR
jgi:hypothetical protein